MLAKYHPRPGFYIIPLKAAQMAMLTLVNKRIPLEIASTGGTVRESISCIRIHDFERFKEAHAVIEKSITWHKKKEQK
jgi:hypothetical protein